MGDFVSRVGSLPVLGLGVSTEYGAFGMPGTLDVAALAEGYPHFARFLEIGIEVSKGLDAAAQGWLAAGRPATYHFLDVNLDEAQDLDEVWLYGLSALVAQVRPAWLCGDAGLWHIGRRDRAHMLLLPPILCSDAAQEMAVGVRQIRERVGREVLPENPPGHVFIGDLHILDFFGEVLERADTGMLLDCAHLAIFQRALGHDPLTGLDGFPLDRVVEMHVAGSSQREVAGLAVLEDDHTPNVLEDTWQIFDYIVSRAPNLKAVVFECERNPLQATLPGFERLADGLRAGSQWPKTLLEP